MAYTFLGGFLYKLAAGLTCNDYCDMAILTGSKALAALDNLRKMAIQSYHHTCLPGN